MCGDQVVRASNYRAGVWVGIGAAAWALVFAGLHAVWAAGWYVGLPEERAREAFQQRWFLVYDLIVAGVCILAVPVALALVQAWGQRVPRRVLSTLAWSGTALLAVRASGALVQVIYRVATHTYSFDVMQLYEAWFCLGAVLFGLSVWRFQTSHSSS